MTHNSNVALPLMSQAKQGFEHVLMLLLFFFSEYSYIFNLLPLCILEVEHLHSLQLWI